MWFVTWPKVNPNHPSTFRSIPPGRLFLRIFLRSPEIRFIEACRGGADARRPVWWAAPHDIWQLTRSQSGQLASNYPHKTCLPSLQAGPVQIRISLLIKSLHLCDSQQKKRLHIHYRGDICCAIPRGPIFFKHPDKSLDFHLTSRERWKSHIYWVCHIYRNVFLTKIIFKSNILVRLPWYITSRYYRNTWCLFLEVGVAGVGWRCDSNGTLRVFILVSIARGRLVRWLTLMKGE